MVEIFRSTIIDAPIDTVWRVLRDFNSHDQWHPAVVSSEIEDDRASDDIGCVRRFQLRDGSILRERLISLSDRARSFAYCIVESPIPLIEYVASVRLAMVTDGNRTLWEWRSSFRAPPGREDELGRLVAQDIYEVGFAGLRAFLQTGAALVRPPTPVSPPSSAPRDGEAIILRAHGGPDMLGIGKITAPPPGPGEARIRQTAIGLNYIDVYVRTGEYPLLTPPGVPGVEAAGIVIDVGPDVTHLFPGDRVAYAALPVGAYASVRTLAADRLVRLPDAIADDTAAAVLLKGLTAHCLARRVHRLRRGQIVLVHAAAGGVGLLLCQWAKLLGATVIGTVSSQAKAHIAREAGCDYPLHERGEELARTVAALTRNHGADVIYDGVGQDSFASSLAALAMRGHYIIYGHASGPPPAVTQTQLSEKSATISSPVIFHYTADAGELRAMARNLFELVVAGRLRVNIGQRYPLRAAAEAHRALEARQTLGSTVLIV